MQSIKNQYSRLKQQALSDPTKVSFEAVQKQEAELTALLIDLPERTSKKDKVEAEGILEEVKELLKIMKKAKEGGISEEKFSREVKGVFQKRVMLLEKEESFQKRPIQDSFSKSLTKAFQKIVPDHGPKGFMAVLDCAEFQNRIKEGNSEISSVRSRTPARKNVDKQEAIQRVIAASKKRTRQLQKQFEENMELNEFEKGLLREEKNRYLSKIGELEAEIEGLARENYRLKEIQKVQKSIHLDSVREHVPVMCSPYVIKTLPNDLGKIHRQNEERSMMRKSGLAWKPFERVPGNLTPADRSSIQADHSLILENLMVEMSKDRLQKQAPNSISGSIGNGNHFDTFQIASSSNWLRESQVNQSRKQVRMTSNTATRNKAAFFKDSLILVRDENVEIAFKKSSLKEGMDKLRVIFYILNKTCSTQTVEIVYDVQPNYYNVRTVERLSQIGPSQQGRQVLEVTLLAKQDLNAVSDMHVTVGALTYDLWLPASFITFSENFECRQIGEIFSMEVIPDKQFKTLEYARRVMPLTKMGDCAYFLGESKMGTFTAKMEWKGTSLILETTERWIYFLAFILHFYK